MDEKVERDIKDFINAVIKKYQEFVTAYIFGSYVKGKNLPESDIDIALIFDGLKDENKFDLQVQLSLLAFKFNSLIEPHPISKSDFNSSNPFAFEIMRTGIEIKSSL